MPTQLIPFIDDIGRTGRYMRSLAVIWLKKSSFRSAMVNLWHAYQKWHVGQISIILQIYNYMRFLQSYLASLLKHSSHFKKLNFKSWHDSKKVHHPCQRHCLF